MSDQAEGLRRLVRERNASAALIDASVAVRTRTRSLLLTSGKGGVGTSNVALNLALTLGEMGRSVLLVDADLGLANLDLLCGVSPTRDLGDVLSGEAMLSEAMVDGPFGVRLLPGAHAMRILPAMFEEAPERLAAELAALEHSAEFVIIDAGSGLNPGIGTLARAADEIAVVTTPEPTATADTHAAIARLRRLAGVRLRVLVNQARSSGEAREVLDRVVVSSRAFLGASVSPMGYVRHDPRVGPAVRSRTPFLRAAPRGAASRSLRRLARNWVAEPWSGAEGRGRRAGVLRVVADWWRKGDAPSSLEERSLFS
jgi:flagellar biosynthesis protein FlhG